MSIANYDRNFSISGCKCDAIIFVFYLVYRLRVSLDSVQCQNLFTCATVFSVSTFGV